MILYQNLPKKNKKKNKKIENNTNKNDNISDNDFNKLMEENNNKINNQIKLTDYLSKINNSQIVNQLIEEQIIGDN